MPVLFKKYSVPVILVILGLALTIFGIKQGQDGLFMTSAVLMFTAALISFLYSSGKVKPGIAILIGAAAGIAAVAILWISYKEVSDSNTYKQNYNECKLLALQNLEDIRYVQKLYAEQNGVYLDNWEDFVDFVKNGKIDVVEATGLVPNRRLSPEENIYLYPDNPPVDQNMTEEEAIRLSKWKEGPNWQADFYNFSRDTVQKTLFEVKFNSRSYKENREKLGFYAFSPDSLPIIPFTKKQWDLQTKDSVLVNDVKKPAILVSGKIPFAKIEGKNNNSEELFFGSLTTGEVDGSWEND
jgi:hypothetical protein